MTLDRSLVVIDDRSVLVDGILRVAQFTYPGLQLASGQLDAIADSRTSLSAEPQAVDDSDADRVVIIGGSNLSACPASRAFRALVTRGTPIIALVDAAGPIDVYALRAEGIEVFVCLSEGMNELLRAIDRAFARESYLSPDAETLFSRSNRVAPRISPRERQIAQLYLSDNDWSVDDVARILQISSQTVRSHLARLRSHLTSAGFSVRNRLELRQTLIGIGVLDPTPARATRQPYPVPPAAERSPEGSRFRYAGGPAYTSKVG